MQLLFNSLVGTKVTISTAKVNSLEGTVVETISNFVIVKIKETDTEETRRAIAFDEIIGFTYVVPKKVESVMDYIVTGNSAIASSSTNHGANGTSGPSKKVSKPKQKEESINE